jgi:alkaline phosphatase D
MPIRPPEGLPSGPDFPIHRTIRWGELLDLIVLDTRQFRTDQPCDDATVTVNCAEVDDPDATILGLDQREWVKRELASSTAAWRTLGQQVLMTAVRAGGLPDDVQGPLTPVLDPLDRTDGNYINADQWDGYQVERAELLSFVRDEEIPDVTVLSGDIHSTWVAELKADFDDPREQSVGAEFCGTSITSDGFTPEQQTAFRPLFYGNNPHISYFEGVSRGYLLADITPERWVVHLRAIDDVYDRLTPVSTAATFQLDRGSSTPVQTMGTAFD